MNSTFPYPPRKLDSPANSNRADATKYETSVTNSRVYGSRSPSPGVRASSNADVRGPSNFLEESSKPVPDTGKPNPLRPNLSSVRKRGKTQWKRVFRTDGSYVRMNKRKIEHFDLYYPGVNMQSLAKQKSHHC